MLKNSTYLFVTVKQKGELDSPIKTQRHVRDGQWLNCHHTLAIVTFHKITITMNTDAQTMEKQNKSHNSHDYINTTHDTS